MKKGTGTGESFCLLGKVETFGERRDDSGRPKRRHVEGGKGIKRTRRRCVKRREDRIVRSLFGVVDHLSAAIV